MYSDPCWELVNSAILEPLLLPLLSVISFQIAHHLLFLILYRILSRTFPSTFASGAAPRSFSLDFSRHTASLHTLYIILIFSIGIDSRESLLKTIGTSLSCFSFPCTKCSQYYTSSSCSNGLLLERFIRSFFFTKNRFNVIFSVKCKFEYWLDVWNLCSSRFEDPTVKCYVYR